MEFLGRPNFSSVELFDSTVESLADKVLVARHQKERPALVRLAREYDLRGTRGELATIDPKSYIPVNVGKADLKALYSSLRDNKNPRLLYDELMRRARLNRCPYCSDREPETLDHYLGKADFSAFTVFASNLVPSCNTCNQKKGNFEASKKGTPAATFHPYFDDVSTMRWLRARIVDLEGPVARIYIDGAGIASPELRARAVTHLRSLKLKRYFKLKSAQEIAGLDEVLPALMRASGRGAVVQHLQGQAAQRSAGRVNSWERALFEALAADEWYLAHYLPNLVSGSASNDPRRPIAL